MTDPDIIAPVNPLTLKINGAILDFVLGNFIKKQLPNFAKIKTSGYRTVEHNASVGGVANSAHTHGLAEDFQLAFQNGSKVSEVQAKSAFDQFIKPNWPGFSEFEPAHGGEGYHIHVQLSREITTYAGIVAMAGLGVLGFAIVSKWGSSHE
jgi:hypothetical protein